MSFRARVLPAPDRNGWLVLVGSAFLAGSFLHGVLAGDLLVLGLSGVALCLAADAARPGGDS